MVNKNKKEDMTSAVCIATEDTYGCKSLLLKSDMKQLNINAGSKYKVIFETRDGSKIFKWVDNYQNNRYKYIIIIFDLDSPNSKGKGYQLKPGEILSVHERMLTYDKLIDKFESRYNKGRGINITHPERDNYIGNKVVLIPIFFCFESLLLYDHNLLSLLPEIRKTDCCDYNRVLIDYDFTECLISFFHIYKTMPPQSLIKYIYNYLLLSYFSNSTAAGIISADTIKNKNIDQLFDEIDCVERLKNITPNTVVNNVVDSIVKKAVFNRSFSKLLQISSDKDMDDFVYEFCFGNFKYSLKNMFSIYAQMSNWDPYNEPDYKSLNWYTNFLNNIYDINIRNQSKECLDRICSFLVDNFSIKKNEFIYDTRLLELESPVFLPPENYSNTTFLNNQNSNILYNGLPKATKF